MTIDKPGFRRSSPGVGQGIRRESVQDGVVGGPFSQAQILHLMKTEFARARRHDYPVACVLLRVDRLQALTEVHGADLRAVIRGEVARIAGQRTRGHDLLGMMSDGSYLLVMPHTDREAARIASDRLRESFSLLEIMVGTKPLRLTMSLGIAACEDQETMFFDTLVAQAEMALERAMQVGGDRVVVFHRDDTA